MLTEVKDITYRYSFCGCTDPKTPAVNPENRKHDNGYSSRAFLTLLEGLVERFRQQPADALLANQVLMASRVR